jgi:hypothetical protein
MSVGASPSIWFGCVLQQNLHSYFYVIFDIALELSHIYTTNVSVNTAITITTAALVHCLIDMDDILSYLVLILFYV